MRYFFHQRQGETILEDPEGLELGGLDEAMCEAEFGVRDIIAEGIRTRKPVHLDNQFEVMDRDGILVHTLPFADVLASSVHPVSKLYRR